mmetsp:Transcript_21516/g.25225  ORF Transcript_21516/g.25225 Transcript_21516/m.25225 type:complete len:125 (+) Transcript_21516:398-772(+)
MLGVTNLCLSVGAYNLHARMTGLCCACCLGCINFAALITTAVFRFNSMGKLAALSTTETTYEGTIDNGEPVFSDKTIYSDDASIILALWIVQLAACICSCCIGIVLNKPPSQEELARAMQAASE